MDKEQHSATSSQNQQHHIATSSQNHQQQQEESQDLAWNFSNLSTRDSNRELDDQVIADFNNFILSEHDQQPQLADFASQYHQELPQQMEQQQTLIYQQQQWQHLLLRSSRIRAAVRALSDSPSFMNLLNQIASTSSLPGQADYYANRSPQNHFFAPSVNTGHEPIAPFSDLASTSSSSLIGNIGYLDNIPPPSRFQQYRFFENHASTSSSNLNDQFIGLSRTQPRFSPEELKDMVHRLAKTPSGSRKLQKIFQEGSFEENFAIATKTIEHLHELIINEHGTKLVQKIIAAPRGLYISRIVNSLAEDDADLLHICRNDLGNQAIQQLLTSIKTGEQLDLLFSSLSHITVPLVMSHNGSYIIKKCFNLFKPEFTKEITTEILNHCIDISKDKSGCCIMQECLSHTIEAIKHRLLYQITENASELSKHAYGNYVVQYIVSMEFPTYTRLIVDKLAGNFIDLSKDKFGSHVVEKCILLCPNNLAIRIIREIMDDDTFLFVLQDRFGNYVIQKSLQHLQIINWSLFTRMADKIQNYYNQLHGHLYGKRVLELAIKLKRQQKLYLKPSRDL